MEEFGDILKGTQAQSSPAEEQAKWGPYDWEKPSKAVVTHRNFHGCILWYAGAHISYEIEEGGLDDLGDLGLDDAPDGISVWEGTYIEERMGGWEEPNLVMMPKGEFRSPTAEEWQAIQENRCPWDKKDWLRDSEGKP